MTVCKDCIDSMYNTYLSQCNDARSAVRQVCRKLDLYWSDKVFDIVERKNTTHTMMTGYISKLNTVTYSGKSYDDTLSEEGTLWTDSYNASTSIEDTKTEEKDPNCEVSEDILSFWGSGYTPELYAELEKRLSYWMSKFPEEYTLDIGEEAIIKQICALELDINRDRAAGRPVDKSINALNTLLGSGNLKPAQKRDDSDTAIDKTPLGVWAQKLEFKRPIKEIDPELQDVDGVVRYISIWFLGHLCKMLGIKNSYCKLYEQEIEKMRIEHPEYEEEDDETLFNDIFNSDADNEGS